MCDPVTMAVMMGGSAYLSAAGEKAQAGAQYAYGMQTAATQRKWNAMHEAANKKATLKAFHDSLSQLQNKGMQEASFITKKTNHQIGELAKVTSMENLSAAQGNVVADLSDNMRRRGALEVDNQEALASSRTNIESLTAETQSRAHSRLISGVAQPVQDPIKPDTGWGLADLFSIGAAAGSGYAMMV